MSIELLQIAKLPPFIDARMKSAFTLHDTTAAANPDALIAEVASRVRGILGLGVSKVPASLLERLPRVEIVATVGVGYDGVDLEACKRRGIVVANTPDVLNDDVADVALSLVLNTSRGFVKAQSFVVGGDWEKGAMPLAATVRGKTAGIVGLGKIGKEIARRLEACKVKIVYHGRHRQDCVAYPFYASLRDMAAACDFLVLSCPGGKETNNLVDAGVLASLGAKGTLINVSRGSVVDEAALIDALGTGKIKAAGLDVFVDEPRVPQALRAMNNVVLYPHLGSSSVETRTAMGDLAFENLSAHFAGRPVPARVI